MRKKVTLIDGSGFIFRAYHALPPFTRPDGTPVGAVFGFCNMLMKFLSDKELSERIAVIFDAGRETFRMEIYPEYKAHRPPAPDDLIPQFPLFREAALAFGLPVVEKVGFEADDVIATYADQAKAAGYDVVIISADKDLMQLVNDHVSMIDPLKNRPIGEAEVLEKFGVSPHKVIEVQALMGDSSDNVPGVPSIGPKTAAELISQFGSLEGIYENLDAIKQPKRRQVLEENREKAFISRDLVTLRKDVPLELSLSDLANHTLDQSKLAGFFKEQGFNNLIKRLGESPQAEVPTTYECMTDASKLKNWLSSVTQFLAIDCETTSLNTIDAELVGIALAKDEGIACYIPLSHQVLGEKQLPLDEVRSILKPYLNNSAILKIGHNLKYDLAILKKYDLDFLTLDDTLIMSYILDSGKHRHGLDFLAQHYFQHTMISYSDVTGAGKNQKRFDEVDLQSATKYAAEDADYTLRLYHKLRPRIFSEKQSGLYFHIEKPVIHIIQNMEEAGITVNPDVLKGLGQEFHTRLQVLEQEIYELAGHAFNIGSPKQLSDVLFHEMGLPQPKKNKTGAFTTDADVLEDLALQGHTIAQKVSEWRGLAKLQSTYVEGLLSAINEKTQRVHTSYNLAGTTTGRLSSSDPNLQNIPIRTEDGRKIRAAFVAAPGHKLVSFDYSQIELRLLAHEAAMPSLIQAFKEGKDIHKLTASQMFHTPLDEVTSAQRRQVKAINFGIIYGISAYGLSQQLKIPQKEAQDIIDQYFRQYPGIQAYMERMKVFAREHGYVTTLMGRRCYTPGILDKNYGMRQFAERQAINAPLQGSNADINKKAMIDVNQYLRDHHLGTKMLLQVHDELIFEVPENEVDRITKPIQQIMENVTTLTVPLVVDIGVGTNWDET